MTAPVGDYATSPEPGTIRLERRFAASCETVWSHLAEPEARSLWLAGSTLDLRPGGAVDLKFHLDTPMIGDEPGLNRDDDEHRHGRVTRLKPPHLLAFTWGEDGEVLFDVTEMGEDSCRIVLTHRRLGGMGEMIRAAAGWYAHFNRLGDVLDERMPRPFWADFATALLEHEDRIGEPPLSVRLVRHFACAPERIFDAWLDPSHAALWMFGDGAGQMVRTELDPRPSGVFVFTERRRGEDIEHRGRFLEIDRPNRLVFEFGIPRVSPERDRVSIDISPRGEGCDLVLVHQMKPVWAKFLDQAEAGWVRILAKLVDRLHQRD
ncbi:SRPBCC domain-containing protein [Terrihabitans sp. B22-R8]|uniref:SRPBCC domain-containing protein n=1 Tax=Terrihabitans sp. B22-R8 TaxID=3425128 RepID=UPI00403C5658